MSTLEKMVQAAIGEEAWNRLDATGRAVMVGTFARGLKFLAENPPHTALTAAVSAYNTGGVFIAPAVTRSFKAALMAIVEEK